MNTIAMDGLFETAPKRDIVDDFVVHRTIADHGDSAVFEATDQRTGETRALKVARREAQRAFAQLLREYEALVDIDHPNVVRTHGIVALDELSHAMVLDLLEGATLLEWVRNRSPLTVEDASRLLCPIADALQAVHEQGWLHCDIKPSNIVIREDGSPVIIDFAVARPREEFTPSAYSGTPDYSSPEQIRAEPLDPRSDVYSFGATAYFVLTGRPPYLYGDLGARFRDGDLRPPPSLSEATGLPFPPDLENTIASMLALERDDRPNSMRMVRALFEALTPSTLAFDSSVDLSGELEDTPTVMQEPGRTVEATPMRLRVDEAQEATRPLMVANIYAPHNTTCAIGQDTIVYALGGRSLVYSSSNGQPLRVRPSDRRVERIAFDGDGNLHTIAEDGTVVIVNADGSKKNGVRIQSDVEHLSVGNGLAVVKSDDGTVRISRDNYETWWCELTGGCDVAAASPNGEWFATGEGAEVCVYRLLRRSYEQHSTVPLPEEPHVLALADDGRVCAGTGDGSIFVEDDHVACHCGKIEGLVELAWSDSTPHAVACRDGRLLIFEIQAPSND